MNDGKEEALTTILGIDPGSRVTGFGVINWDGHKAQYLASGCIRVKAGALPDRLCEIHCSIKELMEEFKPKEFSIESVFMHQNAQSALKLGQARGVALVVARLYHAEVFEYSPRQVKQSVVGYGAASKSQVQEMIKSLLKLKKCPPSDAADALAIALTHAQNRKFSNLIKQQLSETKL